MSTFADTVCWWMIRAIYVWNLFSCITQFYKSVWIVWDYWSWWFIILVVVPQLSQTGQQQHLSVKGRRTDGWMEINFWDLDAMRYWRNLPACWLGCCGNVDHEGSINRKLQAISLMHCLRTLQFLRQIICLGGRGINKLTWILDNCGWLWICLLYVFNSPSNSFPFLPQWIYFSFLHFFTLSSASIFPPFISFTCLPLPAFVLPSHILLSWCPLPSSPGLSTGVSSRLCHAAT